MPTKAFIQRINILRYCGISDEKIKPGEINVELIWTVELIHGVVFPTDIFKVQYVHNTKYELLDTHYSAQIAILSVAVE